MASQLEKVIKRTQAVYKQATKDLEKKLADFRARFAEKDKEKQALLAAGEITAEEYKSWLSGQVFQGKIWEAKAKEAAKTLTRANEEAAAIVNDGCMTAYAAAMNYGTYALEKATGLSTGFTLYNRETVSRLIAKDPQLLPRWKIDQPKDYVWNYGKVKNAVTQGIIQGKPIPEITKDLTEKLQTTNENRMRLFARTGMTGAHNAGRMDALHRAEEKGIRVLKKWLATNDERTRDSHADLDGQIREIDEPFTTTNRDGTTAEINYPGDPTADPEQVYNCRCTMVYIYPEVEETPEDTEPAPEYEQMSFDQWVEAKENQEKIQGETDTEKVTMKDAREPEPEIIAEAAKLEQTEPEPIIAEAIEDSRSSTERALDEYLERGETWTEQITEDERSAVSDYGYNTMSAETNGYLRGEPDKYRPDQVKEIKQRVERLDGAIEKGTLEQETVLYRGVGTDYLGLDFSNPESLVGTTVTDGAYMSTTGDEKVAAVYSRGVVIEMKTPEGTHAAFVDLSQNTAAEKREGYRDDKDAGNLEYLLQRGMGIRFTGYEYRTDEHGQQHLVMQATLNLPTTRKNPKSRKQK